MKAIEKVKPQKGAEEEAIQNLYSYFKLSFVP